MVRNRRESEEQLKEVVRERLAHVLAESMPNRSSIPLPFEPSDDDDEDAAREIPAKATTPAVEVEELIDPHPQLKPRRFTRTHLGVIAVLLLLGVGWAGWGVLRAKPVALATPVAAPSPTESRTAEPVIKVHVLGAVKQPGVIELSPGSRVADALDKAGGLSNKADPGELNLAQVLDDGEQIVVGTKSKPQGEIRQGTGSVSDSGDSGGKASKLDLNTAEQTQLEELPGVGPVTAGKIVAWRDEHKKFSRIEELQEVPGIGPKTFAEIAPHVRV